VSAAAGVEQHSPFPDVHRIVVLSMPRSPTALTLLPSLYVPSNERMKGSHAYLESKRLWVGSERESGECEVSEESEHESGECEVSEESEHESGECKVGEESEQQKSMHAR
jgi:hypothetical protein